VASVSNVATIAGLRLAGACLIVSALALQAWADLTYGTFTWDELPGFFTPLAAMSGVIALVAAAMSGRQEPTWVSLMRVNATTYLVITGIVYWALLAPYAHPKFPWANAVLHGGAAVVLALDWTLIGSRRRLPWRTVWTVLFVPVGWLLYLVFRAVTDGWVPYPFLDLSLGVARVAATIAGLMLAGAAVAAILHGCTAWRLVRLEPSPAAFSED
jgi:hypothetical protein